MVQIETQAILIAEMVRQSKTNAKANVIRMMLGQMVNHHATNIKVVEEFCLAEWIDEVKVLPDRWEIRVYGDIDGELDASA